MPHINFYHTTGDTPAAVDAILPTLLEKALAGGGQALVICPTPQRCQRLDETLWTFQPASFLPHATLGSPHPAPVTLTHLEEIHTEAASALPHNPLPLLLAGTEALLSPPTATLAASPKILYLFNASEGDVTRARTLFKSLKSNPENQLAYYQQTAQGWQKK